MLILFVTPRGKLPPNSIQLMGGCNEEFLLAKIVFEEDIFTVANCFHHRAWAANGCDE